MSQNRQKKNIVIPETDPKKSTDEAPVKSKMTKKTLTAVTEFTGQIRDFLISFLQEQSSGKVKVKIQDVLSAWQSEESQTKLFDMVKMRLPVPEPTKRRKSKDLNAPKRPRTSYILFCKDKRAEIKEKFPDLKMPDISKKLGELWKGLKDQKKQPYLDEAAKDKERYDSEMEEYGPKNKAKGPKRSLSSYFFFCAEKRSEVKEANPDMKVTDISKELGRMWKEDFADEKSREKWIKSAADDKKRYEAEKAEWIQEHPEDATKSKRKSRESESKENDEQLYMSPKDDPAAEDVNPRKGKKAKKTNPIKVSGMVLYMQRTRPEIESEHEDWNARQVVAEMKKRWSALSAEERAEYDE